MCHPNVSKSDLSSNDLNCGVIGKVYGLLKISHLSEKQNEHFPSTAQQMLPGKDYILPNYFKAIIYVDRME